MTLRYYFYQQVRSVRLVNKEGIIRPETFYKYLFVWYNMDYLGTTMSQVGQDYDLHLEYTTKKAMPNENKSQQELTIG